MNRLGMLVDLSHVSPETMNDALRVVGGAGDLLALVGARAVADVPRNVPDESWRALPKNGGVVMVTFVAAFIVAGDRRSVAAPARRSTSSAPADVERRRRRDALRGVSRKRATLPKATLAQVADHIEHVRKVAGVDHVGTRRRLRRQRRLAGGGLEDVSTYPGAVRRAVRRGWSDADLAKLAGGNVLRVAARGGAGRGAPADGAAAVDRHDRAAGRREGNPRQVLMPEGWS